MDKQRAHQLILQRLDADLEVAVRAARTAHEAATHEENVAENKYDTLGLEAAYLAAGQSRRVEEIRQALASFQGLVLRDFDADLGIQTSALVELADRDDRRRWLFLGPDAAGLKIALDGHEVLVITPRSPLGGALLGRHPGDEVEVGQGSARQAYEIVEAF
ncbi:GreA/GreB family elongation factor [Pseudomonas delhiensis]|uniref:GreA/GreB family elongation factor n=1 Tax=Pseudomonas delhiensis TaxID=366289 RepID=A0A239LQN2_9PSED|nr:GreA/GreB family elongation factor [Pseudomonas delhiensis]SDJ93859.1 GreA/GreB family elongation factor [Pseudomonas delhiensis]SNT32997.1 GreA/GreB family elongation factor [Pseudomonas delhiensis]